MKKYDIVFTIAQTVLVTLKLIGVISWSWWWVFAPSWIPFALLLILLIALYTNDKIRQLIKGEI